MKSIKDLVRDATLQACLLRAEAPEIGSATPDLLDSLAKELAAIADEVERLRVPNGAAELLAVVARGNGEPAILAKAIIARAESYAREAVYETQDPASSADAPEGPEQPSKSSRKSDERAPERSRS